MSKRDVDGFAEFFRRGQNAQKAVDQILAKSEEEPMKTRRSIDAVVRALDAHKEVMGIGGGPEVQVWHLLVSIQDYCHLNGIDFRKTLADVDRYQRYEAA